MNPDGSIIGVSGLQGVEIEYVDDLRSLVAHQQILLVEGDGHGGRLVAGRKRGDLRIVGAVEGQHFVLVAAHHEETAAHWIGHDVGQRSGDIDEAAHLIGSGVIHQHSNARDDIDGRAGLDRPGERPRFPSG